MLNTLEVVAVPSVALTVTLYEDFASRSAVTEDFSFRLFEPSTSNKAPSPSAATVKVTAVPSASLALKAPTTAPAEFSTTLVLLRATELGASFAPLIVKLRFWAVGVLLPSVTCTENVSVSELLAPSA